MTFVRIIHNTTTILLDSSKSTIEIIPNERYLIKGSFEAINITGQDMPTKNIEKIILPISGTMLFYVEQ